MTQAMEWRCVILLGVGTLIFAGHALAQTNSGSVSNLPQQSFLTMGGIVTKEGGEPSPHFTGKDIPEPPGNRLPWTAPTSNLDSKYVSATVALFEAGMADPRGCDYREIEVGTGDIWQGDGGVVKTHGWILPGTNSRPFAVCWNGLVYPVISTGLAADWKEDARTAAKGNRSWRSVLPERVSVAFNSCIALKGCLVLRLGEPELAAEFWKNNQRNEADPYLSWANEWSWNLFERAICAHMRGDDGLALASARALSVAKPRVENMASKRGFQQQTIHTLDGTQKDYLNYTGPLPQLLLDQEWRSQHPTPEPFSSVTLEKLTNKQARIAFLLDNIDEVAVRQWGQPGGLGPWETDPIVAALIKEGEPAIEPILTFLEHQTQNRLTRSVSFGRDFQQYRYLHPIQQPLANVLTKLMNTSSEAIGYARGDVRSLPSANVAAMFRSYWEKYGKLPVFERWYRTLLDDQAGERAWTDALQNIVKTEGRQQGNTNSVPGSMLGAPLRSKINPTITQLLLHRYKQVSKSISHMDSFAARNLLDYIRAAEKWEGAPFLPDATQLQNDVMESYSGTDNMGSADCLNATVIAHLAMFRGRHGDTKGLDGYANWIQKADPAKLQEESVKALEPFWQFPRNPALRAASSAMFANTNSAWGSLRWMIESPGHLAWSKPLASPVIIIPEIRVLALNELTNREVVGEATINGGESVNYKLPSGTSTSGGLKEANSYPVGTKIPIRRCDIVADQVARIPGFPAMSLLWPEERRDEAVKKAIDLLQKSGDRLIAIEPPPGWSAAFDPPLVRFSEGPEK